MNIRVWSNFTKRVNSTRQPAATDGRQISCYLKEETSIRNPSFILADPMPAITYVQAFGNYYFVDDIINMDANRSEVVCSLDVLATYKASILGYTAFVERSASNYDSFVNDNLLSSRQLIINEQMIQTELPDFFAPDPGVYIVQAMDKEHGVCFYSTRDLTVFKRAFMPDTYTSGDIQSWINSKIAQEFALDVYIGSVKWMPFSFATMGIDTLYLGLGPLAMKVTESNGVLKYLTSANPLQKIASVELNLPTTNIFGDFRDCNPEFSEYNLLLPAVGIVQLDPMIVGSCIHSNRGIYVTAMADIITGSIVYMIDTHSEGGSFQNVARYAAGISCDVPIGKSRTDLYQTLDTALGTTQNMLSSFMKGPSGVAGGLMSGARGSLSVLKNLMQPQTSMTGGSGNKADLFTNSRYYELTVKHFGHKDFPTAVAGRPLMQNLQLSSLSGFCQCGNASVPVNAPDPVRDQINAFLNGGFYIE